MTGAAIFDLDRTLLPGGSGPAITAALTGAGLMPAWQARVSDIAFGVYERLGESRLTMELTRRAVSRSVGWSVERVAEAAIEAAEVLAGRILPRARLLIDAHRGAGRRVALATTTARPLIAPLAARLGATDVLATRWQEEGGVYTGQLDGPFLWGPAKRDAVVAWAEELGIPLAECSAYSDSIYDLPLLEAVGQPHAANPDARLRVLAVRRRWPILDLRVPEGVVAVAGRELLDATLPLLRPALLPFARWQVEGSEHIPEAGGALISGLGASPLDGLAVAVAAGQRGRKVRFHGVGLLSWGVAGPLLGTVSDAVGVSRALAQGEVVAVRSDFDAEAVDASVRRLAVTVAGTSGLWPPRPRLSRPQIRVRVWPAV